MAVRLALLASLGVAATSESQLGTLTLGDRPVDLVIAWYCEDITWLKKVNHTFASFMTVMIYNKAGTWCKNGVPSLPFRVITQHLENVGRDGHTQTFHIDRYYDDLANHTIFLQGDVHWTMKPNPAIGAIGWEDQAAMLNDMVPRIFEHNPDVAAVLHYVPGQGPVNWEDAEDQEEQPPFVAAERLSRFGVVPGDYFNGGREVRASLFGGSPCDQIAQRFTPGMQFIARRDVLRTRSRKVWQELNKNLANCHHYIWNYERNLLNVLNTSLEMLEPPWKEPSFCKERQGYEESTKGPPEPTVETAPTRVAWWSKHWKCDAASAWLRRKLDSSSRQASTLPALATESLPMLPG